jgi:SAM-dependent methyltransferase
MMNQNTFCQKFVELKQLETLTTPRFRFEWKECWPCLQDDTAQTSFDAHYIYHTAWAARVLSTTKPKVHFDISSSLYFASLVSAFMPVKFYDYRPAPLVLSGLTSEAADLFNLPFEDHSILSLSCMHVVEHIGLGRYGDPLDYNGDLRAISELKRVISNGGSLLFVVPIGQPRICFNAHRIYSFEQIRTYFSDFKLEECALIPDDPSKGMIYNPAVDLINQQKYGCGCFWLNRP